MQWSGRRESCFIDHRFRFRSGHPGTVPCNDRGQVVYTLMLLSLTKQYNLVLVKVPECCVAVGVTVACSVRCVVMLEVMRVTSDYPLAV